MLFRPLSYSAAYLPALQIQRRVISMCVRFLRGSDLLCAGCDCGQRGGRGKSGRRAEAEEVNEKEDRRRKKLETKTENDGGRREGKREGGLE